MKITYLGKELSGNGFEYRNFRVDKWKSTDDRTPDRVAAERGEVNTPSDNKTQEGGLRIDVSPEPKEINPDDIPF